MKASFLALLLVLSACAHAAPPPKDPIVHILFNAEVDEESVNKAIDALTFRKARVFVIEFNTPGGYVSHGFRLTKAIEASRVPVICVVDGTAASMGFYLLQSCGVRVMTFRSVLMAHEPALSASNFGGTKGAWKDIYERLRVLSNAMNHHMSRRLNISYAEFSARVNDKDWWMDAEEAWKVRAIDGLVHSVDELMRAIKAGHFPEVV